MYPDCTPAVIRAVAVAQQYARQTAAPEVQPLHLLAGLVAEEEGQAALCLARLGTDPGEVRRALGRIPPPPTPEATWLPLGQLVQQAIARARELSAVGGDPGIASEPVLLALLAVDAGLAGLLEPLGFDRVQLDAELRRRQPEPVQLDEPLELGDATERMDAARILDAAANRAREGLRVVEDYCRFALDDTLLTTELKQLRHDLTAVLTDVAPALLLEARETLRDVGTQVSTAREGERHSLRDVARANCKRVQEALRSLEEVGKLFGADLGARLEPLRYRSYTLERALLLGADARPRLAGVRLYVLLSGAGCTAALDWTIHEAAAGGAGMFQLREKQLDDRALLERARNVRRWTRAVGALFILNDRPDIARLAEADGVHVGQDELPVKEARRILGPGALVGVSTHSIAQLRQAILDGASYVGVGPTFPSSTKPFDQFPGLDFVSAAAAQTTLPAFIIGGVTTSNVSAAAAVGAQRVAVSAAVCQADDPRTAAAALCRALD